MTALLPVPITEELIRGAVEVVTTEGGLRPYRLPAAARARADAQVLNAASCPAGVRLVFRTAATALEIDAHRTTTSFKGMPPRPDGRFDLIVDGTFVESRASSGGCAVVLDLATGGVETEEGPVGTIRFTGLPAHDKHIEVWLPHHEPTTLVALRADAPIAPAPHSGARTWLHHGSSISQGSNAAGPSTTWAALAAAAGAVELVNLGFSGGMMLDPFVARAMRDLPADLISVKIGINVVGGDVMRLRAFAPAVHGFLDTIRDGHPTAPLLVVGPILCPIHESTPGPGLPDFTNGTVRFAAAGNPAEVNDGPLSKLTLQLVRDELGRIVADRADDPNLHLLDGLSLYGEADAATLPLPDRLHPDAATHRLIAERFVPQVFGPGGPFA